MFSIFNIFSITILVFFLIEVPYEGNESSTLFKDTLKQWQDQKNMPSTFLVSYWVCGLQRGTILSVLAYQNGI